MKVASRVRKHLSGYKLRKPTPRQTVILCAVLYAVLLAGLSVYKHEIYASSRFDLGNMDQAVWNSSQGRILEATDEQGELTSRLKNHADLLLLAFVPLYWIYPSPIWLLVVQAAVVGAGAVPLFLLAKRFLGENGGWPAALVSIAYLFNPGLQSANLFDFHAQTMAGTLLLFAFYYLIKKRLWPFAVFAVLASLAKEEISLIVAMMGLYAIFPLRRPRWGIPVFTVGSAYFLFVMLVLIPAFNPGDASELVEGRYDAFGGSMTGVVRTALSDPGFTLSYIFTGEKLLYLVKLLGIPAFLALFAPFLLAIPLPELAINLLSDRPQMTSIDYHYSAPILPFIYLAAAAGISNLTGITLSLKTRLMEARSRFSGRISRLASLLPGRRALRKAPLVLAVTVLLLGVEVDYRTGPLPLFHSPGNYSSVIDPPSREHLRALDGAVSLIPDDAPVSTTNPLGPHLAHRRYLYLFPTVQDAEYVVIDETEPSYDTYTNPVLNLSSTLKLERSPDYRKIYSRDGVTVFERTAS